MAKFRIHIDADLSRREHEFIKALGKGDMQAGLKRVLIEGRGEFSEDGGDLVYTGGDLK